MNSVLDYLKTIYQNISIDDNGLVQIYTSTEQELNSVKYGVGIYNRSESAIFKLTGKDVLDFLQRISTNNVIDIQPFYYVPTLFTNEKGRLIDRTILVSLGEEFYLVGSKKNDTILERWLNKYIITEDVIVKNRTGEFLILDVIGPQAESYLTMICGKEVEDLDNNKLHEIKIEDSTAYLLKKTKGYNETLYWLIAESHFSQELFKYLLSHTSVFDLSMIGEDAFDYYRVLNKVPQKPNEINDNFNPHEAGLLNDVSFTKGCYIGQEIIARLDTYDKVQKNLNKIRIEGLGKQTLPVEFFNKENENIGILTTMVNSFENSHKEGLAYIRKEFQQKNIELKDLVINNSDEKFSIKIID